MKKPFRKLKVVLWDGRDSGLRKKSACDPSRARPQWRSSDFFLRPPSRPTTSSVIACSLLAGRHFDTGLFDTGLFDTGRFDTGLFDTGLFDTGLFDTGRFDTGLFDTGLFDTEF
uniref:Pentapeptide repeat-containing protein n=1 Tax=Globodera rostochiensis TaxID=31243 RepID=A0A914GTN5_GLORO